MRDFPSCFGESGVQIADSSCSSVSKASQNVVTCVYKCKLLGQSCLITLAWSKTLMGQCLSVEIDDLLNHCLCKMDVKPSLFSKRKGSKCLELINSAKIELFWDLSSAGFGSGPEPVEGYYLAVVCEGEMVLLIGDLRREASKKTNVPLPPPMQCWFPRGNTFLGRGFLVLGLSFVIMGLSIASQLSVTRSVLTIRAS
ncbi:hypothetical protein Acr_20g0006650 [Actinidia rufa]|uniref:Uncharacterized protein n=1 Tax=Actinidia rufa TaxID=165716 RepID=A0A7J0GDH2_9ERIC|nr:hypothetical protein Acr_20g0006650 [Actinidia rufa]